MLDSVEGLELGAHAKPYHDHKSVHNALLAGASEELDVARELLRDYLIIQAMRHG